MIEQFLILNKRRTIIRATVISILTSFLIFGPLTFAHTNGFEQNPKQIEEDLFLSKAKSLNLKAESAFRSGLSNGTVYLDSLKFLVDQSMSEMVKGYYFRANGRKFDTEGDRASALEYYQKAIQSFKAAGGDPTDLAFTYVLKAFVLNNSLQYKACLDVINEGLPFAREAKSKNSLCFMLDFMGDYHFYEDYNQLDYRKALSYYKQVESHFNEISNTMIISDNYSCQAVCYAHLAQEDSAYYYFEKGETLALSNNHMEVLFGLYNKWGQWLQKIDLEDKARSFYLKAYEEINKSPLLEFRSRGENMLYNYYLEAGDYKNALFHYSRHWAMEDSLDDNSALIKYQELEETLLAKERQLEIEELKIKNLLLVRRFLLFIVTLLVLLGLALYYLMSQRQKIQRIEEEKLRQLEIARITGQTQERSRIASELHDNVNTKIAGIRYRLEALASLPEFKVNNALTETIRMVDDAYQDVRFISKNIIPENLGDIGLDVAIRDFVNKLSVNDAVKFEVTTGGDQWDLLGVNGYEIYLIIFELLNNVLKHSNASLVQIRMVANNQLFNIEFTDNGHGFDMEKQPMGSGIKNILSRVQFLNGKANFENQAGKGASFSARIPLV